MDGMILPFAMGACQAVGGNVITDAFGIVAMVAMTPLITIQILGAIYERRAKVTPEMQVLDLEMVDQEAIINFDWSMYDVKGGKG